MKVGGTRRLLIPAALAYGANPPAGSGIPPNADLVFDITLVAVQ
jgi:FKBP-type peptidyl-prolyl cis-trans isomerase FkpA